MTNRLAFLCWLFLSTACAATHQTAVSRIGAVTLTNYQLNDDIATPDPVNYKFITSMDEFLNLFHLTKGSPGKLVVPDFGNQSVAAIILPPTEKVKSIEIQKAELAGHELNIHYSITDTTTWTTFKHRPNVIATVPKAMSVKKVYFYENNRKVKSLPVSFNNL